jgi:cytochrome c oxidase subunit 2
LVLGAFACGGGDSGSAGGGDTPAVTAAPLGNGSIAGVVNFTGTAPANPAIDMAEEAACAEKWADGPTDPIVTVQDGKLANAFVRVTGGLPAGPYPMPGAAATIDQDGCLYSPRVVGVMVGQDLAITNSDPVLHNIKAVPTENRGFNISQPRAGMTTTRTFNTPEVMVPLECNVHGWMNAYVGVVEHPYFAVSAADGSFTISGLPAGGTRRWACSRAKSPLRPTARPPWNSHLAPEETDMGWILPRGVSTYAGDIDFIYYLILVITGIAFVVTEVGLIWFLIKYRAKPGRRATYTHGSTKAEVIWTAVPAVTVVLIGVLSGGVWNTVKGREAAPANSWEYAVLARQFEWAITHPGADGRLNTADDDEIRNQLHIPVNQPVLIHLTAEDVIHSFFVPAFRVKQDAVPGMSIEVWFEAMEEGEYEVACAELCGNGHTTMGATVTVHSAEGYAQWLADRSAN